MPRMEWNSTTSKWTKHCSKCEIMQSSEALGWDAAKTDMARFFCHNSKTFDELSSYCRSCANDYTQGRVSNGLTRIQMAEAQNNQCGICKKDILADDTRLVCVDHNHKTGQIRKLLCVNCNNRMAAVDDTEWLAKAIAYRDSFN